MLPSLSTRNGPKPLQMWKREILAGSIFIFLLLLLYVQFTMINTTLDGTDKINEQAHLQGKQYFLKQNVKMTSEDEEPAKIISSELSPEQVERRLAVSNAMKFAWGNYEKYAFGSDEIDPVSGKNISDVWGGIACTLVDSLDTLYIMEMKEEFQRAKDYVAKHLEFSHLGRDGSSISLFETIIREVGGLLSAYELSKDDVFKQKAKEMMDLLLPAFNETEGVFYTWLNPSTKLKYLGGSSGKEATIAELGTLQLETRYLSDITGDPKYAEMGDAFYQILRREGSFNNTGLFPVHFNVESGKFDEEDSYCAFGALGDSFYEYLLKVYIYSGQREEDKYLRELYDDSVRGLEEYLLYYSVEDDLNFVQEMFVPSLETRKKMDHLLCFVPGMLALGTLFETQDHEKNTRHLKLAEKLMETCYQLYRRQPTGLSPDTITFPKIRPYVFQHRLRPETVESLFYLYRITKNPKYRDYGWKIFEAMETHAKTKYGYSTILNVSQLPAQMESKMESFVVAETLKYHYLLQASETIIPLDKYVFNTEAHPFRIRKKM